MFISGKQKCDLTRSEGDERVHSNELFKKTDLLEPQDWVRKRVSKQWRSNNLTSKISHVFLRKDPAIAS